MTHELEGGDFLDDFAGALKSGFFAEGFNDLVDGVDFRLDFDHPVLLQYTYNKTAIVIDILSSGRILIEARYL